MRKNSVQTAGQNPPSFDGRFAPRDSVITQGAALLRSSRSNVKKRPRRPLRRDRPNTTSTNPKGTFFLLLLGVDPVRAANRMVIGIECNIGPSVFYFHNDARSGS